MIAQALASAVCFSIDVAARQFQALINADLHVSMMLGDQPDDERIRQAAINAVRTFLRAFGKRRSAAAVEKQLASA